MVKKISIYFSYIILILCVFFLIIKPSDREAFESYLKKPIPNSINIIEYKRNQQACAFKFLSENKNDVKKIINEKKMNLTKNFDERLNQGFSALNDYIFNLLNEIEFYFDENTEIYSNFDFVIQTIDEQPYEFPILEFIFIKKDIYLYMCVYTS